jgi:uncharacterized protein
MKPLSILIAATLLFMPKPGLAQASFDCGKASTATEKAICATPSLSMLDRQLATAYKSARGRVSAAAGKRILSDQRAWLAQRDRCGAQTGCLAGAMQSRIGQLQQEGNRAEAASSGFSGLYCQRGGAEYLAISEEGGRARIFAGMWTNDGFACSTPPLTAHRTGNGYAATDFDCTVTVSRRGGAVVLTASPIQACRIQYCGRHAYLDELSFAPSSRRALPVPFDRLNFENVCG